MCALFAATYPDRTAALVLYGAFARRYWAPDFPFGNSPEDLAASLESVEREWGQPRRIELFAPTLANDERFRKWFATYLRVSASPGAAAAVLRMSYEIDVRHVLPAIRVPTLVVHRTGDRVVRVEHGRFLAERIPNARLLELAGDDHPPWVGDIDALVCPIEEFLTGTRHEAERDRVLATVLFTDIAGSTSRLAELGDRRWREVLEQHHAVVRRELAQFRGREIETAGDGFLAAFDGPARAIRCASRLRDSIRALGLEIRAGLHTGECEVMGDKLGGIAVHIGARLTAMAAPGDVLVSSTVKDLVAGSGLRFNDRGVHVLKGVPGEWRLFAVDASTA